MFHRHRSTYRLPRQWKRCCASTTHQCRPTRFSNFSDRARWRRSIERAVRRIPRGSVSHYHQISKHLRWPRQQKRDFARWLACTRDGGDASAHCCRANITRPQAGDACRIKWSISGVNRNSANKERCEKASSLKGITCEIHKGANSVLCKLTAVVVRYLFGLENEILRHPPARSLRLCR